LVAVGGCAADGAPTGALEAYDPARDAWTKLPPLPAPRCAHAVTVVAGKLYVLGGWDGQRYVRDVWVYDPTTQAWATGTPMPVARGFLGAATLGRYIYVVGGYDGRRELALAHRYNPADTRGEAAWEALPPMTEPRGGMGLAAEGGALFAVGGGWRGGLEYNERFDPLSNTWSRIESPFTGEWRNAGVTTLGAQVYVVGGWSGDYLNTTAVYQSSFRAFLPLGGASRGKAP
jgi:N-acetylneuraminic acid mutarotase